MDFKIPKEVLTIIAGLECHGHEAYLVGGCVRDLILGKTPKDFDICTSAHPCEVQSLFEKNVPTGLKHGTVTVIVNRVAVEVTTFRVESAYSDRRRPDSIRFSSSLTEDLMRRDFTINAIAYHPEKGIIDPFAGCHDLDNKIIRTVGKAEERFEEDALRMLRAIRFQARFGFSIDSAAIEAIRSMPGNIRFVSRERILAELNGILSGSFPEAFCVMFDTGLIHPVFPDIHPIYPDLKQFGLLPAKLPLRWAALLMQIGITDTERMSLLCSGLKMSNPLKSEILKIMNIIINPLPNSGYILRKTLSCTGAEAFSDALAILKTLGKKARHLDIAEEIFTETISRKTCFCINDMAINGSDLIPLGFARGKELGDLLRILFLCVLQKPELNRKDILLELSMHIRMKSFS